jgi:hypothetical protein
LCGIIIRRICIVSFLLLVDVFACKLTDMCWLLVDVLLRRRADSCERQEKTFKEEKPRANGLAAYSKQGRGTEPGWTFLGVYKCVRRPLYILWSSICIIKEMMAGLLFLACETQNGHVVPLCMHFFLFLVMLLMDGIGRVKAHM